MISEALLEFEESLSGVSSSTSLLLNNLDLKVDLNRFSAASEETIITELKLTSLFADYKYDADAITTCSSCGKKFAQSAKPCCTTFVESQKQGLLLTLEKQYWLSFFANPNKTILTLPNYTKMVFLQTGIPFQLRPLVWQKLILVNQLNHTGVPDEAIMIFRNFQHLYNKHISEQINKDLKRTFPEMAFFQKQETVDALLTILNVYANYDLELGYCQGLLFMVGTLYYHFQHLELTFHTLCKIMECEPEVRSLFVPMSMSSSLSKWMGEFLAIFAQLDPALAAHLTLFCDCSVFLYQWFLSIALIHSPEFEVNNRIVDFCLMEGWKVGIFKISLGLLIQNKPILMSFGAGDEEVVYQHLLNESKWGNVINNVTSFFGDLLVSWNDDLFASITCASAPQVMVSPRKKTHKRTGSFMVDIFKNLTVSTSPVHAAAGPSSSTSATSAETKHVNRSLVSVFSVKNDNESICSDLTSMSDGALKKSISEGSLSSFDELILENQMLKFLLKKAHDRLGDEALRSEIRNAIDLV